MVSNCHRAELAKAPLFASNRKIGAVYYCPKCLEIQYYEGQFCWVGWQMRSGKYGYGAYYGKQKPKAMVAPNHGLLRKEMMAANAYQPEI